MNQYRAYFIDHNNRIAGLKELEFETDEEAIAAARELVDGKAVELWTGAASSFI